MKAVAKKPHQDSAHKKRHGTIHSPLNNAHSINNSHQTSIIQLKPICPCDGGCPRCVPIIQPKLIIGQPNDKYEQEADRVADEVMRMPEPGLQRQVEPEEEEGEETLQPKPLVSQITPLVQVQRQEEPEEEEEELQTKPLTEQITPLVQRQVEPEEEEEEEEAIQTKLADGMQVQRQEEESEEEEEEVPIQTKQVSTRAPAVTPNLASRIQSLKGGGQPLSESTRAFFEPRFGHDFSQVRLHTDTKAAESARAVNARAYTVGRDIVFGTGQFSPGTTSGQRLLSHELTHVVQQLTQPELFTRTNPISVQRWFPSKEELLKPLNIYLLKQKQQWAKHNTEAVKFVEFTMRFVNKAHDLMRYVKITEARGAVRDAVCAAGDSIIFAHRALTLGGNLIQNKHPPPPLSMTLSAISTTSNSLLSFSKELKRAARSYNVGFFRVVAKHSFGIVSRIQDVIRFISRTIKSSVIKYYSRKDIRTEGLYSQNMKASVVDVNTGKAYNVKCVSTPGYWHIDAVPLTKADTKILARIYGIYTKTKTKTKTNRWIESYFAYSCPITKGLYGSIGQPRKARCETNCIGLWNRRAVFFIISDGGKQIIIPASQHGAPHGKGIRRIGYGRCETLSEHEPNKYPGHFCIHFRKTGRWKNGKWKKPRGHPAEVRKSARKLGFGRNLYKRRLSKEKATLWPLK